MCIKNYIINKTFVCPHLKVSDNEGSDEYEEEGGDLDVVDDDDDLNSDDSDNSASEAMNVDDDQDENVGSIGAIQASVQTASMSKRTSAGNQHTDIEEPVSKVTKMSKKDLYKPPTNEELNQLKETENLFHSTLFRLQVLLERFFLVV